MGWLIILTCSSVAELWGMQLNVAKSKAYSTRVPLAAIIKLVSGHRAQPRSNQGWFL